MGERWMQFVEWWETHVQSSADVAAGTTAVYLASAFIVGAGVALLHWLFRGRDANRPAGLGTTLILLCVIVSLVTHVIGGSLARGFGLVGALSIVRFRTAVTDTRDTAFVIFSVAIGMAVGAGYMRSAAVAVPALGIACLFIHLFSRKPIPPGQLKLKLGAEANVQTLLAEFMGKQILRYQLVRSGSNGKDKVTQATCHVYLSPTADPAALVSSLKSKPGVLKVNWSSRIPRAT